MEDFFMMDFEEELALYGRSGTRRSEGHLEIILGIISILEILLGIITILEIIIFNH